MTDHQFNMIIMQTLTVTGVLGLIGMMIADHLKRKWLSSIFFAFASLCVFGWILYGLAIFYS